MYYCYLLAYTQKPSHLRREDEILGEKKRKGGFQNFPTTMSYSYIEERRGEEADFGSELNGWIPIPSHEL